MFAVIWRDAALDQLADVWVLANPADLTTIYASIDTFTRSFLRA